MHCENDVQHSEKKKKRERGEKRELEVLSDFFYIAIVCLRNPTVRMWYVLAFF